MAAFFCATTMTPYLVSQFQDSTLSALIREVFGYEFSDIFVKDQVKYLYNYLKQLGAKSILLEPRYIDRDFLEDFSRYYVKRFNNDGHVCGRLHFFSCEIDHRKLDQLMLEGGARCDLTRGSLQDHYLGFVVIKPLSRTFVGKTCLRVSGDVGSGLGTKKKISKRYDINLFGIKLHVSSIAFQEQDKVVAACATTAIWTALHGQPGKDVKCIPSCSEITIAALNYVDGSNNGFPNKELSNKQIQRSLDVEGLRYHTTNLQVESLDWFRQYVATHIDSDLPLILSGAVFGSPHPSDDGDTSTAEIKGGHAITLVGYDAREGADWLYAHDDRLGPYARARLINVTDFLGDATPDGLKERWALAFSHRKEDGTWEPPHEILVPDLAIVPADKKARLPYQYAYGTAVRIAEEIKCWMDSFCDHTEFEKGASTFTIKLSSISQIRDSVLNQWVGYSEGDMLQTKVVADEGDETYEAEEGGNVTVMSTATPEALERWNSDKLSFLTTPMARLQWDIDFLWNGKLIFKILLDATDIPLGDAVSAIFIHDLLLADLVLEAFKEQTINPGDVDEEQFYSSFLKTLKRRDVDYESHLNKTYGALRAPKSVERSEVSETGQGTNPTTLHRFNPLASERSLALLFPEIVADSTSRKLIWAIGRDGSLFVAEDLLNPKRGHPSMTGLQAARIAGEMKWNAQGACWLVNARSGRYSFDYAKQGEYLQNALIKIASFYPDDHFREE